MLNRILLAAALAASTASCTPAQPPGAASEEKDDAMNADMSEGDLIAMVTQVRLSEDGERIIADGQARTGGWTEPRLEPAGQEDGTVRYRFVAVAPAGLVTQAFEPIQAELEAAELPEGALQMEVIAERGSVTLTLP